MATEFWAAAGVIVILLGIWLTKRYKDIVFRNQRIDELLAWYGSMHGIILKSIDLYEDRDTLFSNIRENTQILPRKDPAAIEEPAEIRKIRMEFTNKLARLNDERLSMLNNMASIEPLQDTINDNELASLASECGRIARLSFSAETTEKLKNNIGKIIKRLIIIKSQNKWFGHL